MMIVHSQWRVKVAISLVFFLAMYGVKAQSVSETPHQKPVTITGQNISFEEVLRHLSAQTKLYFIYSSNSVELQKSLSVAFDHSPLHEVFKTLGAVMHLTFRIEGKYVVVKTMHEVQSAKPDQKSWVEKKQEYAIAITHAEEPVSADVKKIHPEIDRELFIPSDLLKKNLMNCTAHFTGIDSTHIRDYFPLAVTNPRPNRIAFTSFGLIANEYSGGLEIRAGLPYLYGVFTAGLMRDGYFRNGFGIGTTIRMKSMITLNPIYTFATLKQKQDQVIDEGLNLVVKDGLKMVGKHHQIKFLFQIQASKRLAIHVGPTFNFLKTSYTYQKGELFYSDVIAISVPSSSPGYYVNPYQVGIMRTFYYSSPPDYSTHKSWVGFEAGISYSLKFPSK